MYLFNIFWPTSCAAVHVYSIQQYPIRKGRLPPFPQAPHYREAWWLRLFRNTITWCIRRNRGKNWVHTVLQEIAIRIAATQTVVPKSVDSAHVITLGPEGSGHCESQAVPVKFPEAIRTRCRQRRWLLRSFSCEQTYVGTKRNFRFGINQHRH